MSGVIKSAALLLAIAIVSSCAGMQKKEGDKTAGGTADATQQEGYRFGADDILHVVVEEHPEWSGDFIVKPDGNIVIPNYGEVKVEGATKQEVQTRLAQGMSKYLNNPKVSVDTVKYVSQVVYVLGEVNRPGEYPTAGKRLTLKDAVILAGLPARFAVTTRVYVISPGKRRPEQKVINLYQILYKGETERNVPLHPGDIVYVPKSLWGRISDFFSSLLYPVSSSTMRITSSGVVVP